MQRFERDGRWCEVGKIGRTYCDGDPCYTISGRGDYAFYLGIEGKGAARLLAVDERPDGWTVYYTPGDNEFPAYAQKMIALGAWGK